jgi:hypothetical protein
MRPAEPFLCLVRLTGTQTDPNAAPNQFEFETPDLSYARTGYVRSLILKLIQ